MNRRCVATGSASNGKGAQLHYMERTENDTAQIGAARRFSAKWSSGSRSRNDDGVEVVALFVMDRALALRRGFLLHVFRAEDLVGRPTT